MKKIVVAFDSFKGSLSSSEASEAFIAGVKSVDPAVECCAVAIADGGEGMAEAIVGSVGGEMVSLYAHDPLGRNVEVRYGLINEGATAIIPISSASGLTLLAPEERNPLIATTYGTGELILDAVRRGCRRIIIGLGGSATNDGGVGLLRALGYKFLDANGVELTATIDILECVDRVVAPESSPIAGVDISVAVDVDNPLCGEYGASYVYGSQKGASKDMIARLDTAMRHYADVVARWRGCDIADKAGMGAAGGAGFAFGAVLDAIPQSGIELILNIVDFDNIIADAALVVTGEGRIDHQTVMGKAPAGVLRHAKSAGVCCVAVGGGVQWCDELQKSEFDAIYAATPEGMPIAEAMKKEVATANLQRVATSIVKEFLS
ncbi:MAG: glycerate kinase [Alistipes sp.]|nr:glycerate kinase [Alistipes sp.]